MTRSQLGPAQRAAALTRLQSQTYDVLVIGGGVTGAGAALDAVTRGLTVALVEAHDYGSGTSSRSSKLIHGGLRYLEQRNFGLVREALRERSLLFDLAPHLVRPVPFLFPLTHRAWERAYVGSGLLMYDTMGGAQAVPRHRHLSKKTALAHVPALRPDALRGAVQYYDAQVDDARLTLTVLRTAAEHGADIANSAEVTDYLLEDRRVTGARVRDVETGTTFDVSARCVISATGVWSDEVQSLLTGTEPLGVRASKGVHLVVPKDRIASDTGLILRTPSSVMFVIPWDDHWLIGTTDTHWSLDKHHPAAAGSDIDYLLTTLNAVLTRPLSRSDIVGTYAGLRPLIENDSEPTSRLSREHRIATPAPGLTVIAGGKLTTYRVMAKDAVDAATAQLEGVPGSCTHRVRLLGAEGFVGFSNSRDLLAQRYALDPTTVERLMRRYGTRLVELLDLIDRRPELAKPLPGAEGYLAVEALYSASHEGALHLDDVLTRRTRASIETDDRGIGASDAVADLVGSVLGWNDLTRQREVDRYRARVAAEIVALSQPDDSTAQAARAAALDARSAAHLHEEQQQRLQ